ncbi:hypothetical protein B0I35DRAFT_446100 [Stachybotrys elegans]|uniref:FAD-binding PCMH-type domain-containing protein n=1 Tax=Stachybotrys elegans TaxID=80388 RepID=A0A8K0SBM5_9HYPO|nr:hypothetical protein B0I35DRAFT_446100 [Stachybotrys elegans]
MPLLVVMHKAKSASMGPPTILTLLVLLISATYTVASDPSIEEMQLYFQENLSQGSETYVPYQSNYTAEITQPWNALNPPTYRLAVKPAMTADLPIIIQYAGQHGIPFLARGAGHGFTTSTSVVTLGINIDLGFFNHVEIDAHNNLLRIGGSVTFGDVFDLLYAAGKEVPTGYCSCVGMVGATLGGGIGPLQGLYGLISDALVSVTMVVGTGDILTISDTENVDLFWAIRGAGANFGIVTSATYKIHDLTNQGMVLSADFIFPAPLNQTVFQMLDSYSNNIPDEFAAAVSMLQEPTLEQPIIMVSTYFFGSAEEGMRYNQPFLDIGPTVQNISVRPWNLLAKESRFGVDEIGCMKGNEYSMFGTNMYSLESSVLSDVFGSLTELYSKYPQLQGTLLAIELHPKRFTMSEPSGQTAYAYRNTTAYSFLSIRLPDASFEPLAVSEGRRIRQMLATGSGNPELETYVNYAHGDEGPAAWYSVKTLPRLRELKRVWDPQGIFGFYNPI